ncbi:hypothetical protein TRVL_04365 [Trypanosoma vivax]|nr:hypothetical protein TRVL_04365 [Trypanosoma vivax]
MEGEHRGPTPTLCDGPGSSICGADAGGKCGAALCKDRKAGVEDTCQTRAIVEGSRRVRARGRGGVVQLAGERAAAPLCATPVWKRTRWEEEKILGLTNRAEKRSVKDEAMRLGKTAGRRCGSVEGEEGDGGEKNRRKRAGETLWRGHREQGRRVAQTPGSRLGMVRINDGGHTNAERETRSARLFCGRPRRRFVDRRRGTRVCECTTRRKAPQRREESTEM